MDPQDVLQAARDLGLDMSSSGSLVFAKDMDHIALHNYSTNMSALADGEVFKNTEESTVVCVIDLGREEYQDENTIRERIQGLDARCTRLIVMGACPQAPQWIMLGEQLPAVRELFLDTGFGEAWVNDGFPGRWELDLLVVASACAELFQFPQFANAQIGHVVFLLTAGLRFIGPSNTELIKKFTEDVRAGTRTLGYHEFPGPRGTRARYPTIYLCSLAADWFNAMYPRGSAIIATGPGPDDQAAAAAAPAAPRLRALEIVENDALHTFERLYAVQGIAMGARLERLVLRHCGGTSSPIGFDSFEYMLKTLARLRELDLSLGAGALAGGGADRLMRLHLCLPRGLEVLRFRGPAAMAGAAALAAWAAALGDAGFLPGLRRLSFVLDGAGEAEAEAEARLHIKVLYRAKVACRRVLEAARARGVEVEELEDPWGGAIPEMGALDSRWRGIDADVEV